MRVIHHFLHRWYNIPTDFVLNRGPLVSQPAESSTLAAELQRSVNQLQSEAFDIEHGRVDYDRIRGSSAYAAYQKCARELQGFDPAVLTTREEQSAFWINVYNALIVDAVIHFGLTRSVHEVRGFFWRAAYSIGGLRFNANDIEFGILRANAPHPAIPGQHFEINDPRLRFSLKQRDPRVHFALNCASASCPPINFYAPEKIDRQLEVAARSFINNGGVEVDRDRNEVWLSKIFQWYAPDFGGGWLAIGDKQPLLEFVANYIANEKDRAYLLRGHPNLRFATYDWSLNRV